MARVLQFAAPQSSTILSIEEQTIVDLLAEVDFTPAEQAVLNAYLSQIKETHRTFGKGGANLLMCRAGISRSSAGPSDSSRSRSS